MGWKNFTLDEQSLSPFEEVVCPDCGAFLVIHAPDPRTPERLLGVCEDCHAWYLIHYSEGKMMRLPDPADLVVRKPRRKGSGSHRS